MKSLSGIAEFEGLSAHLTRYPGQLIRTFLWYAEG